MQDVIGIRKKLSRLECEQLGVARTGAHERHAAGAARAGLSDGHRQVRGIVGAASAQQIPRF